MALGDSMTLDNAADFLKTFKTELKCLVTSISGLYDGYFDALAISIEGGVSSGTSLSYSFGFSVDKNGDAVLFYSQCFGLSLSGGIDGAIGFTF
jgi:hypothetical protein